MIRGISSIPEWLYTDPVEIIHASSAAGRVVIDTGKGRRQYWRKLKNDSYQKPDPVPIAEVQTGYITGGKGNFCSGPGTDNERIQVLNRGDVFEILEDYSGCTKCVFNGTTEYVKDDFSHRRNTFCS